jgi:hypothetical protein
MSKQREEDTMIRDDKFVSGSTGRDECGFVKL